MSAFLKNWPVKKLGGKCLSVWGPGIPPVAHCMKIYAFTYSHKEGGMGGSWTSEKVRGALVNKLGVENTNMTDCISTPVNKLY